MQDLSAVNKSLLELESELNRFRSAREALQKAQGEATAILKRWDQIRSAQDETVKQVYSDTVKNTKLSSELVGQMQELYERLNNLAVTVEKVDYPARLDKIDTNISTVTLTMQGLQNRIDLYEKNVSGKVESLSREIGASLSNLISAEQDLENRVDAYEQRISSKLDSMRSDILSTTRSSKDTITALLRGEAESLKQHLIEELQKTSKRNQIWCAIILLVGLGSLAIVAYGLLPK